MKRRNFILLSTTAIVAPVAALGQETRCVFDRLRDDLGQQIARDIAKGVVLGAVTAGALAALGFGSVALLGFAGVSVATGFGPAVTRLGTQSANQLVRSIEAF